MNNRTVYELCQRCGEVDAVIDGDHVRTGQHRCKNPVPGPPSPPRRHKLSEIDWIPAEKEQPS